MTKVKDVVLGHASSVSGQEFFAFVLHHAIAIAIILDRDTAEVVLMVSTVEVAARDVRGCGRKQHLSTHLRLCTLEPTQTGTNTNLVGDLHAQIVIAFEIVEDDHQ